MMLERADVLIPVAVLREDAHALGIFLVVRVLAPELILHERVEARAFALRSAVEAVESPGVVKVSGGDAQVAHLLAAGNGDADFADIERLAESAP